MPRTTWPTTRLTALACAATAATALLLTGCASAGAEAPPPAASHTMPDGTVMDGAEHGAHDDGSHDAGEAQAAHEAGADAPSAAAQMVCGGQVVTAVAARFGLAGEVQPTSTWDAPEFTCVFDIDGAPLTLTVHDASATDVGEAHFDQMQQELGADPIEGMLGLGLPSFSTHDGVVGFLRDGKTLTVDATALPDGFAGGTMTHDEAAYAIASAVLTCWVEHD